jgi:hypothetical protein
MKRDGSVAGKGSFQGYWAVYGGLPSLIRSSYFWIAIVITIISYSYWSKFDLQSGEPVWASFTLNVIPSLMGFALGGMAIMLAFSTGKFLEAIRQKGKENSYFMKVIASFFHFTVVLGLALLVAALSKAFPNKYLSCIGYFATIYGILLAVATVDHLWQTAVIFNKVKNSGSDGNDNT